MLATSSVVAGSAWERPGTGRLVGLPGSEGQRVVRDKLGQYHKRRITRDRRKQDRVPGKPEQGRVKGSSGKWKVLHEERQRH